MHHPAKRRNPLSRRRLRNLFLPVSFPWRVHIFVPASEFSMARSYFRDSGTRDSALAILKYTMLDFSDQEINRNRRYIQEHGWEAAFLHIRQ
jgi:hypothetical protein